MGMRVKPATSVALFLMFLLLGQAMTAHLNQIPSNHVEEALDSPNIVMASNNSGSNNSSGNNSNPANDSHCITVSNFTMSSTYYVTVDLVNICSGAIQYPGVNASASHNGVSGFSNYTNWFYMIGGNDTYNLSWQLSFDQTVINGTLITLDFEADVLHCGANNSWSHECPNSTLSHQFMFISSNSGGNNTGGNTGSNQTGGNNTSGNNSGGNNSSNDSDGDGIADYHDDCPNGTSSWISNASTDYDSDGCEDANEDIDDDNDGINDANDTCSVGSLGWISSSSTDHDSDGCRDSTEDIDDDNDGISDSNDSCPRGITGWTSTNATDADSNGCRDADEDVSLSIDYYSSNVSYQTSTWTYNYTVSNYQGYVYWNATEESGIVYSSWNTYINSNSYHSSSLNSFNESGNFTICAWVYSSGSNNNGSGNTSNLISDCLDITVIIPPATISIDSSFSSTTYLNSYWNFNYSVSNYQGYVYWNATDENGNLYSSWTTYVYSNSYQSGSSSTIYQNGNYTICASIQNQNTTSNGTNTQVYTSDCSTITVDMPPPSITINQGNNSNLSNSTSYTSVVWSFNYSVSNYQGYVYWTATDENGNIFDSWNTYVYPNYSPSTSYEFTQNGNYSICASVLSNNNGSSSSANQSFDCVTIAIYIPPPTISIDESANTNSINGSSIYSSWSFTYSVSHYSGMISWNASSETGSIYSSWNSYAYSNSYLSSSIVQIYQSGNYTVCASITIQSNNGLGNNSNNSMSNASSGSFYLVYDCMNIMVSLPPPLVNIVYSNHIEYDDEGYSNHSWSNASSNNSEWVYSVWEFNYSVSNYYGSIYWNATDESGQLYSTWTTYSSYYYSQSESQSSFSQSGNYTICASIHDPNHDIQSFDCVVISVYIPPPPPEPIYCGDTTTIAFTNMSAGYTVNQSITVTLMIQCGFGEDSFEVGIVLASAEWNQSWDEELEVLFATMPYEIVYTIDETILPGDYIIRTYLGNDWTDFTWNFTIYGDGDNDGINDQFDNCINIANLNQADMDNDGVGDSCDEDIDGDGVLNTNDDLPNDTNESMDTDGDGIGNNADTDDDGDGMADSDDAFPLDSSEQADLDGDGVGDNLDADDDADGITDVTDNCPLIANSDQADLDGDGIGTVCDGVELTVDGNGTISGDGNAIPSIGMIGTAVAISAGFFIAIRREDEE